MELQEICEDIVYDVVEEGQVFFSKTLDCELKVKRLSNGSKAYWLNGQCHRRNGPAVIFWDGRTCYYINGKEYSEEEFLEETNSIKTPFISQFND